MVLISFIICIFQIKGQLFKGYGESMLDAYKNSVATALSKFLNEFKMLSISSNIDSIIFDEKSVHLNGASSTMLNDTEWRTKCKPSAVTNSNVLRSKNDLIEILAEPRKFRFVKSMGPVKNTMDGNKIYTMRILVFLFFA